MKKIKNLTPNQNEVDLVVRIERASLLSGTSGQNYMILGLIDNSGRIEARRWTVNEKDKELLKPNQFLKLTRAATNEYRGQIQLKINDYEVLDETALAALNCQPCDFFLKAPLDIPKHYKVLLKTLEALTNQVYRKITLHLLKKYEKNFLSYPAAVFIHHNVYGGLFWHSYTLVKNIQAIQEIYAYAEIDWELLICGAVLHDLGKVIELPEIGAAEYSLEGKLLGHISLGNSQIVQAAHELGIIDFNKSLKNEFVTLLEHLVLASHGKHEFGSPIEPVTLEAIILSTFDNLDARIYRTNEELQKIPLGSWTLRLPTEDNKMFYRHYQKKAKKN